MRSSHANSVGTRSLSYVKRSTQPWGQVFAFPYAGGGPSVFRDWGQWIEGGIDLIAVAYPGREGRANEPLETDLNTLADAIAHEMWPLADLPYSIFGHSMGAYLGFEVAQRLAAQGAAPRCVIVSGAGSPLAPAVRQLHSLPDAEFLAELSKLNGFLPELLASPELMRYALPILRADITACETHLPGETPRQRLPIVACGARSDPRAPLNSVNAWHHLAERFELRVFEGDHFFLRNEAKTLAELAVNPLRYIDLTKFYD